MTCHHSPGDPSCGVRSYIPPEPTTPDPDKYYIDDAVRVGKHLVLQVRYQNCKVDFTKRRT